MRKARKSGAFERWFYPLAAAGAIALAVHDGAAFAPARERAAPTPMPASMSIAELERTFWQCDYLGATRAMPFAPTDPCLSVAETLEVRKFGGDFGAMRKWWRQNRTAAYAAYEKLPPGE